MVSEGSERRSMAMGVLDMLVVHARLDRAGAAKAPGGDHNVFHQHGFQRAFGIELREEGLPMTLEFGGAFRRQQHLLGGEALNFEWDLPWVVRGPVLFLAFCRIASFCCSLVMGTLLDWRRRVASS